MDFMKALKQYLESFGYTDIHIDNMPAMPDDAIGLFMYSHVVGRINDGSGTRRVQIQVRRLDAGEALSVAESLAPLLDSGLDEEIIDLSPDRWCIARPVALPQKLGVDQGGRFTYYLEVSFWGLN